MGRARGAESGAGREIELEPCSAGGAGAASDAADRPRAHHAVPATGRGKGVLVLGGSRALDAFVRDVCGRLARAGFAALAPDLPERGPAPARSDVLDAAIRHLLDDHATDGSRVGVLAFDAGALRLLESTRVWPRIGCVVDCGGLPPRAADAENDDAGAPAWPSVPTLLLFGERDERLADARRLADALPSSRLRVLPDAGAGFMDPGRADRFAAKAAASAWDAALAFLEASL